MDARYNPKKISLISTPLFSALWNDTAKTGVTTLGTDDFTPALNIWQNQGNRNAVLFNQIRFTPTGKMNLIFSPNERIFLERLTLYCNFADGLVDTSDTTFGPAGVQDDTDPDVPFGTYIPATDFQIDTFMYANIQANRILSNNAVIKGGVTAADAGAWRFPFPGFGVPMDLSLFDSRMLGMGANPLNNPFVDTNQPNPQNTVYQSMATDKGYYLSMWLGSVGQPRWSTLSINPLFATKRLKIWAVLDVQSTLVAAIAPNVT